MMSVAVVFGEIVGFVQNAFSPIDHKLALAGSISDPVKAHINCLGSLLLDGVVGNAGGSGVVSGNGCWWLFVAEFFKGDSKGAGFAAIVEEGSEFSFCSTSENFSHNVAHHVDGTVVGWRGIGWIRAFGGVFGVTAQVVVASSAGACFWGREIGGVAVAVQNHVAGSESDSGVGMGGAVVEELYDGVHGCGSGC